MILVDRYTQKMGYAQQALCKGYDVFFFSKIAAFYSNYSVLVVIKTGISSHILNIMSVVRKPGDRGDFIELILLLYGSLKPGQTNK